MSKLNREKNQNLEQEYRKSSTSGESRKTARKQKAKLKPTKLKYRNFNKWLEDDDIGHLNFQEE